MKDPIQAVKKKSSYCVFRGGSWSDNADYLVVSGRNGFSPGYRFNNLGLRPVRNVKEKE